MNYTSQTPIKKNLLNYSRSKSKGSESYNKVLSKPQSQKYLDKLPFAYKDEFPNFDEATRSKILIIQLHKMGF